MTTPPQHNEPDLTIAKKAGFWNIQGRDKKRFIIVLAIITALIAALYFIATRFSRVEQAPPSTGVQPSSVSDLPGRGDRRYLEQVAQADKNRAEEALLKGNSAIPTPPAVALQDDPLQQRPQPASVSVAPQPVAETATRPQPRDYGTYVDAITQKMQSRLGGIKYVGADTPQRPQSTTTPTPASATSAASPLPVTMIAKAGTIHYARLITAINSDMPGPVLAEVISGPLAGATLIGEFTAARNGIVLKFATATLKDGVQLPVNAIAIDPMTSGYNIADDVDPHTWERVVLPAAAAFVAGLGQALSQPPVSLTVGNSYVVTQQSDVSTQRALAAGAGSAAQSISGLMQQRAGELQPTITSVPGREVGVLLLAPLSSTGSRQ